MLNLKFIFFLSRFVKSLTIEELNRCFTQIENTLTNAEISRDIFQDDTYNILKSHYLNLYLDDFSDEVRIQYQQKFRNTNSCVKTVSKSIEQVFKIKDILLSLKDVDFLKYFVDFCNDFIDTHFTRIREIAQSEDKDYLILDQLLKLQPSDNLEKENILIKNTYLRIFKIRIDYMYTLNIFKLIIIKQKDRISFLCEGEQQIFLNTKQKDILEPLITCKISFQQECLLSILNSIKISLKTLVEISQPENETRPLEIESHVFFIHFYTFNIINISQEIYQQSINIKHSEDDLKTITDQNTEIKNLGIRIISIVENKFADKYESFKNILLDLSQNNENCKRVLDELKLHYQKHLAIFCLAYIARANCLYEKRLFLNLLHGNSDLTEISNIYEQNNLLLESYKKKFFSFKYKSGVLHFINIKLCFELHLYTNENVFYNDGTFPIYIDNNVSVEPSAEAYMLKEKLIIYFRHSFFFYF